MCTPAKERRITRWEHEPILEAVQRRLDENPQAMRQRRTTLRLRSSGPPNRNSRSSLHDSRAAEPTLPGTAFLHDQDPIQSSR